MAAALAKCAAGAMTGFLVRSGGLWLAEARKSGRGLRTAPRSPGEAWRAFALETSAILAVLGGIFAIALLAEPAGINLRPQTAMEYRWVILGAAVIVPVALGYEIWLLWSRLAAFRRGEVFLDEGEVAAPAKAPRKRRETPAQARRRKAFWRELALVTVVWLFCTGVIGWAVATTWWSGKEVGPTGLVLAGLMLIYPVYVILSVYLRNEKDRGR